MEDKERNKDDLDAELNSQVNENTDIRQFTVRLEEVIQTTCRKYADKRIHQTQWQKDSQYPGGRKH